MTARRGSKKGKKAKKARPSPARNRATAQRASKRPSERTTKPKRAAAPMGRKTLFDLPPLELECIKAVWALGLTESGKAEGVTVREIGELVSRTHRRLAYTTVETIMDRLTRKEMVARQKKGRAHRYHAVYQLEQARSEGLATLLNHFFEGSRGRLQAYLAGHPIMPPRARPTDAPAEKRQPEPRQGKQVKEVAPTPQRRKPVAQTPLDTALL